MWQVEEVEGMDVVKANQLQLPTSGTGSTVMAASGHFSNATWSLLGEIHFLAISTSALLHRHLLFYFSTDSFRQLHWTLLATLPSYISIQAIHGRAHDKHPIHTSTTPASGTKMARYSRNKGSPARPSMSRWLTALYVCAVLIAPMLFMGMIPSARAQEDSTEATKDGVSGPGKPLTYVSRAVLSRTTG